MLRPGSRAFIILLGALSGLTATAIDMSLPALPELTRTFGTTTERAQLTVGVFVLGFAVSQLAYGPLSDRFGRKPLLLAGIAIFTVAGAGCALATSIEQLIAWRFVQGIGACVGPVLSRAIVRDLFEREHVARVLSYVALVFGLAPLLAPIAGGYVLLFSGWRSIFIALTAAGLVLVIVTWLGLAESIRARDLTATQLGEIIRNYARFLTTSPCVGYSAVICLVFAGLFAYISGSSFVLIEAFEVPRHVYGYLFGSTALALMSAALLNGRLVRRVAPDTVLTVGVAMVTVASVALVACAWMRLGGLAGLMLPMATYAFGFGLIMPNAMAAALEPLPDMAGVASALIGFLQMAGGALASYVVSALYDRTSLPLALCIGTMGAATCIVYVVITAAGVTHRPLSPDRRALP